jgi:two-component system NtrC family sensor kinase
MKYIVLTVFLAFQTSGSYAQFFTRSSGFAKVTFNEDSLRAILDSNTPGTTRIDVLLRLSFSYSFKQPDTSLLYAAEALERSRRLKYDSGILVSLIRGGEAMRQLGDLTGAMKDHLEALELSQRVGDEYYKANALGHIGLDYYELHDYQSALNNLKKAVSIRKQIKPTISTEALFNIFIGKTYSAIDSLDSAMYFLKEANKVHTGLKLSAMRVQILGAISFGDLYLQKNRKDSADFYYRVALKYVLANPEFAPYHLCLLAVRLSEGYTLQNKIDSSFYYARFAFQVANKKNLNIPILESSRLLSQIYREKGKLDSVLYYQDIAIATKDSIFGEDKLRDLQLLVLQEQRRNQEIQQAEERNKNSTQLIGLVSITTVILIASILLFRSNRVKQKTNLALQKTLTELKSTQSQLIQSEKMASLGELTAGIAHEIQNPLNFVNNFSELNKELIGELKNEVGRKNLEEIQAIAINIESNEEKIRHHGQRADAIVKSMLQHSRANSGKKELTDLNVMCDEYVRLAYHGLRAKDKSADVKVETHFDPSLSKVNVVPQDIGRVILNLLNNAFYTVIEKNNASIQGYTPTVKISTKQLAGKIEIHVEDDGTGIPDSIKEKIFQTLFHK